MVEVSALRPEILLQHQDILADPPEIKRKRPGGRTGIVKCTIAGGTGHAAQIDRAKLLRRDSHEHRIIDCVQIEGEKALNSDSVYGQFIERLQLAVAAVWHDDFHFVSRLFLSENTNPPSREGIGGKNQKQG